MADLLKCRECGGMVSSEAHRCPQCNTGREGIRGAECKVCLGLLKISEATYAQSGYFHNYCYQKVSRPIVERKKTINCPVCQQPNHFSFSHTSSFTSNLRNYSNMIQQICAKCGHPYAYQPIAKDDPYSMCIYCGCMLENSLEVQIIGSGYAHKVCNNRARQCRELQKQKYSEEMREKQREEEIRYRQEKEREKREEKQKNLYENLKTAIADSVGTLLVPGGFCFLIGYYGGSVFFGILFAIRIIWIIYITSRYDP